MQEKTKMSKGRIAVYSGNHQLQNERLYYTDEGLRNIMSSWMESYPRGYYIQVRPYIPDDKPKKIRFDIIKDEPKKERPPAKYTNIPTYDYQAQKNGKH